MSRAVLISIRPKWCEKIADGEKTTEVRKTRPKLETPFRGYIYKCGNGKVTGEFVCDRIDTIFPATEPYGIYDIDDDYVFQTCLENGALWDYGRGGRLYGWHISNLKIYDHPRNLWEFIVLRKTKYGLAPVPITRPPQSWQYVEELK